MSESARPAPEDRATACLLGLALGDALGAPHEGGPIARALWRLLCLGDGPMLRWTDDTQMSLAAAESFVALGRLDQDDLARRWAEQARWSRGYGPGTLKTLRLIRKGMPWRKAARAVRAEGSLGNGAAMRAAPLALLYRRRPDELPAAAALYAEITHAHPLGVEGGVLMARAVALALDGVTAPREFLARLRADSLRPEFIERLDWAATALQAPCPGAKAVRRALGDGLAAHESVVTALYAALRHSESFVAAVSFLIEVGGDVDTMAAMAGSLIGAWGGALPPRQLARLEQRERLEAAARALARLAA